MPTENKPFDNTQLLAIIERVEKLNEDVTNIALDIKDIFEEAKSSGFEPKYIKACIKLRAKDPDEIDEEDMLLKMYRDALGL